MSIIAISTKLTIWQRIVRFFHPFWGLWIYRYRRKTSNLYQHALRELTLAGLLKRDTGNKDDCYDGMIGKAVLELVERFARQGHSGGSANLTIKAFTLVASFKPLTPITSNPDEWMEIGNGTWQSRRCSSLFSQNGGKTWRDIDEPEKGYVGDG